MLLIGLAVYVACVALLYLTENPNLFPTVVLVGSLLVPMAYVAYFYERRHLSRISVPLVARAFIYGGLLGVIAASILEPLFLEPLRMVGLTVGVILGVGLIEEAAKVLGLFVVAHKRPHHTEITGIVLGAAAGMGFAMLESMGYAFTAFLRSQGSVTDTVTVTLVRGLVSPLGHGTWTAIIGGMLFRESAPGHYRLTRSLVLTYLLVSLLHAAWDGLPGLMAIFLPAGPAILLSEALVGATGLAILWWRWREAVRLQLAAAALPLDQVPREGAQPQQVPQPPA
ncbi:MAG: PrsW family intramembrane metalloprotease [Anaerolineae bacterium]